MGERGGWNGFRCHHWHWSETYRYDDETRFFGVFITPALRKWTLSGDFNL